MVFSPREIRPDGERPDSVVKKKLPAFMRITLLPTYVAFVDLSGSLLAIRE